MKTLYESILDQDFNGPDTLDVKIYSKEARKMLEIVTSPIAANQTYTSYGYDHAYVLGCKKSLSRDLATLCEKKFEKLSGLVEPMDSIAEGKCVIEVVKSPSIAPYTHKRQTSRLYWVKIFMPDVDNKKLCEVGIWTKNINIKTNKPGLQDWKKLRELLEYDEKGEFYITAHYEAPDEFIPVLRLLYMRCPQLNESLLDDDFTVSNTDIAIGTLAKTSKHVSKDTDLRIETNGLSQKFHKTVICNAPANGDAKKGLAMFQGLSNYIFAAGKHQDIPDKAGKLYPMIKEQGLVLAVRKMSAHVVQFQGETIKLLRFNKKENVFELINLNYNMVAQRPGRRARATRGEPESNTNYQDGRNSFVIQVYAYEPGYETEGTYDDDILNELLPMQIQKAPFNLKFMKSIPPKKFDEIMKAIRSL